MTYAAEVSILAACPRAQAIVPPLRVLTVCKTCIKSQPLAAELQDENGPAGLVSEQSGCSESSRAAAPVPEEQQSRRPLSQLSRQPNALSQAEQQPAVIAKNNCSADSRPADAIRQHADNGERAKCFEAATLLLVAALCLINVNCRFLLCMSPRPQHAVGTDKSGLLACPGPATSERSSHICWL